MRVQRDVCTGSSGLDQIIRETAACGGGQAQYVEWVLQCVVGVDPVCIGGSICTGGLGIVECSKAERPPPKGNLGNNTFRGVKETSSWKGDRRGCGRNEVLTVSVWVLVMAACVLVAITIISTGVRMRGVFLENVVSPRLSLSL